MKTEKPEDSLNLPVFEAWYKLANKGDTRDYYVGDLMYDRYKRWQMNKPADAIYSYGATGKVDLVQSKIATNMYIYRAIKR